MSARVRPGAAADVDAMLEVKRALAVRPDAADERGGFLLGASREAYAAYLERAIVRVLADGAGRVGGFAVVLPDALLRRADLWSRRDLIEWETALPASVESGPVAYFDQLAVLPGRWRLYAPALALSALGEAVRAGHRHLFATVVAHPFRNLASLPLLHAVGARRVGRLDETYDGVGALVSDLYHVDLIAAAPLLDSARARGRVERMLADGA